MWRIRHCNQLVRKSRNYKCKSQAATVQKSLENNASDIEAFHPGANIHGFVVEDLQKINVFNITALHLVHTQTKAKYIHLYRDDNNNVFSINFRTTPMDSTGLPHILEHLVLCGSELYPVRDPFFKMLNRSLATFMNAMTGSDYTIYPFSTQNFTDFQNLQKIYLDAVFRPKLNNLDFMQEGWRLEYSDPKDPNSNLIIKGVVYNEMKGVYSENENIFVQKLQNLILPDHTYGVISGGDPLVIPSLTWDDLKRFHQKCYHPSNARFYSYGNFPLSPSLEYINSEYLSKYQYSEPSDTIVPSQSRWSKPKKQHFLGRFENMREPFEKQNICCVSLLMTDVLDVYQTFLLQFITELLVKGPNSPLYKALIDSNFSGGFTTCTGFDTQQRDTVFTVGLQGLEKGDIDKVVTLFDQTIGEVIANGFEEKHIESVLHSYELSIKHQTENFGLSLLFGLTPILNHDGSYFDVLKVDESMNRLKTHLADDKEYLQKAVKTYFASNTHRLSLSMGPDKNYELEQQILEKKLIEDKTKNLSGKDKELIYTKGLELLKEQSEKQNTDLLPSLEMKHINSELEHIPSLKMKIGNMPTTIYSANTNGVTYFKGILSTNDLSSEQQMLLPLLCYILPKMGTKTMDYREFDSLMRRKTGGLHLSPHIGDSLFLLHSYEPGVLLTSYCLDENVESMWYLWNQLFSMLDLKNMDRFKTLVQLYMSNLTQGLADSGHIYSMQVSAGLVSGAAQQKELLSGLHHITYMKGLVKAENYEHLLLDLNNLAKLIFDKNKMRCSLNISEKNRSTIVPTYETFINSLPGNTFGKPNENTFHTNQPSPLKTVRCQHHVLNIPVYYCSKAVLTVPYTNPEFASLRVLARLLSSKYLHPELREKQGAYGGGARLSTSGVFSFFSYRDPHCYQTLEVFDQCGHWLEREIGNISDQDVLEAKLGVFQAVDAPVPPSEKGANEFLRGISPDILQHHRAEIMTVDVSGLRKVSEKYFSGDKVIASKAVLGPKTESADATNREGESWTILQSE
uniref:Presequence protease, mitochondrial n=1 Tax=Photinus pyralis TaxID=7054 RepID=A0A1Y1MI43_PHOPY